MASERIQRRIERLLDEAEAAADRKAWSAVAQLAREALALDDGNQDARQLLTAAERMQAGMPDPPSAPTVPPSPAPVLPASFVSGRYRVLRLLGQGGRKRVYLARDERLGREVAFAVVSGDALMPADRERFLREARAMARLGSSPNLVSIFDIGEDGRDLFTVQEFMAGGDVARLLADAEERRLPVERTLTIVKDVCRALTAIHQAGIVHRDLKPANIFLAADGSACVGDFGLAADPGANRLTQHGMMLGTVAYMPPEQALGGDITPRSDLYSLGAMLYEMVTGRPPFEGSDPTAVISQHLNTPPVAPSWQTEHCPPALETLILSLLEKDPGKRPASAGAVLAALAAVDPNQRSSRHSDANPLRRLSRGVFVGREKEVERLRRAFDEAFSGEGGVIMLVGEPGIGKTRTAQELETYARLRGGQVLWGRAHETGGAPPFWPWVQAGRAYGAALGSSALRDDLGPAAGELVRIFPELRELVGATLAVPMMDDPASAEFRLFDAYSRFLAAASGRAPLVVVLDDLHWADRPTLRLLQHVARDLGHMRVLVVGTYRDTELVRTHPLSETLVALNREGAFERVNLRGLTKAEVGTYIAAAAKAAPSASLVAGIYEETEGNPFFLSEMVNLMTEEGTLIRESISDIRLPEGVKEALGRRLDRLSPEANELLKVAAVVGREFAYETIALVTGHGEDVLLRLIEEGLEGRVIEETERAGRYRFTHALMQETLIAELSTTRRVRLHGRVGEALERRFGARAEEQAARLAQHFVESAALNAEHADKALRYSGAAGEEALRGLAWDAAAAHFERALEQSEAVSRLAPLEVAALHEGAGRARLAMGQHVTRGFRALQQAFQIYADRRDRERAFHVAQVIGPEPVYGDAEWDQLLAGALALQEEGSVARGWLEAFLGFRRGIRRTDDVALARLATALAIAEATGDQQLTLAVTAMRASVETFNGRDGLAGHIRAAELAEQLGDANRSSLDHFMAGMSLLTRHLDLGRAEEHANKARAAAEETRRGLTILTAAFGQALVALYAGRLDDTEPLDRGIALDPHDHRIWSTLAWRGLFAGDDQQVMRALTLAAEGLSLTTGAMERAMAQVQAARVHAAWWWQTGARASLDSARARRQEFAGRRTTASSVVDGLLAIGSRNRAEMEAWHDTPDPGGEAIAESVISIVQVKGLVDEELGRDDEALSHYENATALRGFSPTLWALPAYERARLLVKLGRPHAAAAVEEVLEVTSRIGMRRWQEKALALRLQLHGIGSSQTSIDLVGAAVQTEQPDLAAHAAPDGTVTLMFSDIVDSTALNERLGDTAWMELLRQHNALMDREIAAHGGRTVKTLGDGYMVAFGSARTAVRCAIAIQRALAAGANSDLGPRTSELRVRIGMHTGEAVQDAGDFFGKHVNLAARIGAAAAGGEILVSSLLAQLVEPSREFALEQRAAMSLKGLDGEHVTHVVVWK